MKKIIAAAAVTGFVIWAVPAAVAGFVDGLSEQLAPRFPDVDLDTIRIVYRKFLWKSFTGQLPDLDDLDDDAMDTLFRVELFNYLANKK